MPRTTTRDEPRLVSRGEDSMTFYKAADSPKPMYPVRVYVAPGSELNVPPHFHLTHDELFTIEQGELDITQNGVTKRYSASSGEVTIPRGTIHSIYGKAPSDAPIITWERTDPHDREKEFIFRIMNSVLLDSQAYAKKGVPSLTDVLQINLTLYHHDGYFAVLPILGKRLNQLIDGALAWVARLLGFKITYPEYVSAELWKEVTKGRKSL